MEMYFFRNQIQQLQSELSRVKELLSREVGRVHVDALLSGKNMNDGGWQGRAEMIENLKYV